MAKYSRKSKEKLASVDFRLQEIFNEVIKHFDCTIIEGKRSKARQMALYKERRTKTLKSKHLAALAIDSAPWPVDWKDLDRFRYFAGFVMGVAANKGYKIRWGGDWNMDTMLSSRDPEQKFDDLVHFELIETE